ncbi:hypothetical protein [Campylobacter pinnipediorum]|uniref:Periplasmic protein (AMIN domain) n=1 Tax=Campylobacter pinnipediorum subsp. pinnipediorum TaxID=1660067 RepID=A0AAX0L8P9_9BACT|nr:hypothetical protein [Campylobacter pinnipediorum]AQW80526.1 hypothetical protein CPIN17260_0171 [Campylobacter pinnipediorum subsp. pinnipediorum]AQW82195.1 hypothetical protein CPIN17261_0134 [Campylobacter pinnipediorum subsp. pinnipediorum]OPA74964.1 hypothetical protein BFG05_06880 [Campylobacter pinnipediorum subsp. pinnipediorum]OPA75008.1 hypothetical protein BFG04_05840 [Campylobacter pinnipediorum subsp. pinnipediorum]
MVKIIAYLAICINIIIADSYINLNFTTDSNVSSSILVKSINQSLDDINSRVFKINRFSNKNPFIYSVSVWRDYSVNLNDIRGEFLKHGIEILKTEISLNAINFTLKVDNLHMQLNNIDFKNEVFIQRGKSNYLVNLHGASKVAIYPQEKSQWLALIRIYDKDLKYITTIQETKPVSKVTFDIFDDYYYALVGDSVDVSNIKGGLILKFIKE